jgi:hypothetical protein
VERIYAAIARQRLGKHIAVATDTHSAIEELLESVFSVWPVPRPYNEDQWESIN